MRALIRCVADAMVGKAQSVMEAQGHATVVDLAVVNAAGWLYRAAAWRIR